MTAAAEFDDIPPWVSAGLPAEVGRKARLLLLDSLACIAAGTKHAEVQRLARSLAGVFPGSLSVPGVQVTLGPGGVAALSAAAMCWDEANEGLAAAHGRPGLPVVPCVLALGAGRTMADVLHALALGYEVGARAGELWRIRPGMHVDGSWHSLGAAATCAVLLGADPLRAVRIAACQVPFSLYRPLAAGMTGRNTYSAHAALLGLLAASAAAAGSDAPTGGLAEARQLALGLDPPGRRSPAGQWLLLDAYLKPYAGVRHGHYAAAAAASLEMRDTAQITRITLHTYAEALRYAANRAPATPIAAQFSLSFATAAGLRWGDLTPDAYRALDDAELRRLEALVELKADPSLSSRAARVTVWTALGSRDATVASVPGDPDRPMTEAEVVGKCAGMAGHVPEAAGWPEAVLRGSVFCL